MKKFAKLYTLEGKFCEIMKEFKHERYGNYVLKIKFLDEDNWRNFYGDKATEVRNNLKLAVVGF